jgi:hypothetical protein
MVMYSAEMYQQELTQKLNTTLAQHIVAEEPLLNNQKVNQNALKSLFHWLMVVNPGIELYLLDPGGEILAYTAPDGHVKRQHVSLQPIHQFIKGNVEFPHMGDDPRGLSRQKVFSAAPIPGINPDTPAGYLYVILEGEAYDSITDMIKGSYILRFTRSCPDLVTRKQKVMNGFQYVARQKMKSIYSVPVSTKWQTESTSRLKH